MPSVPVSDETRRRIEVLFDGEEIDLVTRYLEDECGSNLPFCENDTPSSLDRLRFAALKISCGRLDRLDLAVEMAKQDWRDLLMAADFGEDIHAHQTWFPERPPKKP